MKIYIALLVLFLSILLSACSNLGNSRSIVPSEESENTEYGSPFDEQDDLEQGEGSGTSCNAIPFSDVPSEMETAPLNTESSLSILELPDSMDVPALHAWKLQEGEPVSLVATAEKAASVLWGSYTTEEENSTVILRSEMEHTADGDYQEHISVSPEGRLFFQAGWLDTEETPFLNEETVPEDQAVSLARELATAFGLDAEIQTAPTISLKKGGIEYTVSWPCYIDGLLLEYEHGLTVRVIGNKAVTLEYSAGTINEITENEPSYFLKPEQAIYCINYVRSWAKSDSVMYETPILQCVELLWTTMFAYPDYTPAYAFYFTNQEGKIFNTFYVDAFTGEVATGTNEGNYPPPYHF